MRIATRDSRWASSPTSSGGESCLEVEEGDPYKNLCFLAVVLAARKPDISLLDNSRVGGQCPLLLLKVQKHLQRLTMSGRDAGHSHNDPENETMLGDRRRTQYKYPSVHHCRSFVTHTLSLDSENKSTLANDSALVRGVQQEKSAPETCMTRGPRGEKVDNGERFSGRLIYV